MRTPMTAVLTATVVLCGVASPAVAKKKPREAWTVTRVSDPVTGASSCVVAAYDQFGKTRYSRVGILYPVVENNPQLGLLVGVSSGGQFRVPTGNILWRIDENPHRELLASDNPATGAPAFAMPAFKTGNEATDKAVAESMANATRMTAGLMATSTVASGEKAQEMLREMLTGRSLLYRQASVAPAYGLPSSQTYRVGQFTNEGHQAIPLDESFRKGLAECGIPVAQPN
jgi:hypothetical protein